jgi:thioredoxin 1
MELIVYYFSAPWCGPCKHLGPIIDELSQDFKTIGFVKINTDVNHEMAVEYDVRTVPSIIMKQDGEIVGRLQGAQTKTALRSWLKSYEQ